MASKSMVHRLLTVHRIKVGDLSISGPIYCPLFDEITDVAHYMPMIFFGQLGNLQAGHSEGGIEDAAGGEVASVHGSTPVLE